MSRSSQFEIENGTFIIKLPALRLRIHRALSKLIPHRELYWNAAEANYYIRIIDPGAPDHLATTGPYYYKYLIGLADMLDLWSATDRLKTPKALRDALGRVPEQVPLPKELQFPVVSQTLQSLLLQLEKHVNAMPADATATVTAMQSLANAKLKLINQYRKLPGTMLGTIRGDDIVYPDGNITASVKVHDPFCTALINDDPTQCDCHLAEAR